MTQSRVPKRVRQPVSANYKLTFPISFSLIILIQMRTQLRLLMLLTRYIKKLKVRVILKLMNLPILKMYG